MGDFSLDRNNTSFPKNSKELLESIPEDAYLKRYQNMIKNYIVKNPQSRGCMICHSMGSGKSILAASIIVDLYKDYRVIILTSKSLRENMIMSIKKYLEIKKIDNPDKVIEEFKYATLNAYNVMDQLAVATSSKAEVQYSKELKNKLSIDMENSIILIDEAHNLFNSLTNGSKLELYDAILDAKNIKIIFLTGTPMVNEPFELVPAFNMLSGKINDETLFSESYEDFYKYFVKDSDIINKDKFMNRIVGLVSYYGSMYDPNATLEVIKENTVKRDGYPDELPIIIRKIPMSREQTIAYDNARDKERKPAEFHKIKYRPLQRPQASSSSSYRVKTRAISNFYMPAGKTTDTFDDFKNLKKYSPKMVQIVEDIKSNPKSLKLVYSSFVETEGLGIFSKILEHYGYLPYKKGNGYAVISGQTSDEDREEIIRVFSDAGNIHGKNIEILLISSSGAEGLDLKNIQSVYIIEVFFHWSRIAQTIARAVRLNGSNDLPEKERKVQPYIYLSVFPDKDHDEQSVDESLYERAIKNRKLINSFMQTIIEASLECSILNKNPLINCITCYPNNMPLFTDDPDKDIMNPSPCTSFKEEKVKVKEVVVNDKNYYYAKDDIYTYDEDNDIYRPLNKNGIEYRIVNKAINKKSG